MICIECTYPDLQNLYSKFKSNYIKLTLCPRCGKVADKYIEYDNVLLFIDILLLKPQAYRHLAYNVAESELLKDSITSINYTNPSQVNASTTISDLTKSFNRYKNLIRFMTMTILFEVYLIWAYEEKNKAHSLALTYILQKKVHQQYCFFILKQLVDQFLFCTSVYILYKKWFNWDKKVNKNINSAFQLSYHLLVLLLTIFISSSIKTFPIIMLIWPYDKTSISATLTKVAGLLNTTEALRINASSSYPFTLSIVILSALFQFICSRLILGLGIAYTSKTIHFKDILIDEFWEFSDLRNLYDRIIEYIQS